MITKITRKITYYDSKDQVAARRRASSSVNFSDMKFITIFCIKWTLTHDLFIFNFALNSSQMFVARWEMKMKISHISRSLSRTIIIHCECEWEENWKLFLDFLTHISLAGAITERTRKTQENLKINLWVERPLVNEGEGFSALGTRFTSSFSQIAENMSSDYENKNKIFSCLTTSQTTEKRRRKL